jgi:hypothetical protein
MCGCRRWHEVAPDNVNIISGRKTPGQQDVQRVAVVVQCNAGACGHTDVWLQEVA